jgi:hypothetical protein
VSAATVAALVKGSWVSTGSALRTVPSAFTVTIKVTVASPCAPAG